MVSPQHRTVPATIKAQVWLTPALMATAFPRPGTAIGVALSIVVPVYNGAATIGELVAALRGAQRDLQPFVLEEALSQGNVAREVSEIPDDLDISHLGLRRRCPYASERNKSRDKQEPDGPHHESGYHQGALLSLG